MNHDKIIFNTNIARSIREAELYHCGTRDIKIGFRKSCLDLMLNEDIKKFVEDYNNATLEVRNKWASKFEDKIKKEING